MTTILALIELLTQTMLPPGLYTMDPEADFAYHIASASAEQPTWDLPGENVYCITGNQQWLYKVRYDGSKREKIHAVDGKIKRFFLSECQTYLSVLEGSPLRLPKVRVSIDTYVVDHRRWKLVVYKTETMTPVVEIPIDYDPLHTYPNFLEMLPVPGKKNTYRYEAFPPSNEFWWCRSSPVMMTLGAPTELELGDTLYHELHIWDFSSGDMVFRKVRLNSPIIADGFEQPPWGFDVTWNTLSTFVIESVGIQYSFNPFTSIVTPKIRKIPQRSWEDYYRDKLRQQQSPRSGRAVFVHRSEY